MTKPRAGCSDFDAKRCWSTINTPKLVAPVLQQLAEKLASYDSLTDPGALDPRARLVAVVGALLHGGDAELPNG